MPKKKTTPSDPPKRRAGKARESKRSPRRTTKAAPANSRRAAETQALPMPQASAPPPASLQKARTKLDILLELLRRPGGATLEEMTRATGWHVHSVRGAMAGALKRRGIQIDSAKADGVRRYRACADRAASADRTVPETAR